MHLVRDPETGEVVAVVTVAKLTVRTNVRGGSLLRAYFVTLPAEAARLMERELGRVPKCLYYVVTPTAAVGYPSPPPVPSLPASVIPAPDPARGRVQYKLNVLHAIVQRWAAIAGRVPPFVGLSVVAARALEVKPLHRQFPLIFTPPPGGLVVTLVPYYPPHRGR